MIHRYFLALIPLFGMTVILSLGLILPDAATATPRPRLIIAHDANYEPLVYEDEQHLPQGYLIDFWKHFGEANNIDIQFKLGDWNETLSWIRTGQADIHGGLFFTKERNQFLNYQNTITALSAGIYIANGQSWNDFDTLPTGVVASGYSEHYMHTAWPNRPTQSFPQAKDMIRAAVNGTIQAFIADEPVAVFYLRKFKAKEAFSKHDVAYSNALKVAVAKDRHDLASLIEHGWARMDPKKLKYIRSKWFLDVEKDRDWALTGILIAALVMFFGLLCRILNGRYAAPKS
ncbi:transporter substrate-binding domain-containing protein [Pseudodesulfovibrio sp. JC047]|uniref:transporter substrate-binding domain-containing protein n=1 Tax=Pseudodesulfovibrio sp. JC047 TaxID=2683199 RepID=UPI0013D04BFA|nr:transporter substrate-binding domain-containing protein [Pseudodesulfovibrio sp. JC047]NDV18429.1 transporter substrate-binding domain-containing protein [Pseudodesulfovibrio sp. JC047]